MPYELTRREVGCGCLILAVSGGGSRNLHCTAYTGSGLAFAGVNLAGAEFGKVPGTYATDYTYPAPASIDYFSQLGFNLIRVPFRWERLQPTLESDPPLPAADVLALLFSDVRRQGPGGIGPGDVELRARQNPNLRQTDILSTRATQLLTNPLSAGVGRVVEQTFGVDTFQLTPTLIDPISQSTTTRVNPSARVTIGKRISDRVYLTFSRSLSSSINDQIFLVEYDESVRLSWIVSRNEDQTYAVEVRVRHAF